MFRFLSTGSISLATLVMVAAALWPAAAGASVWCGDNGVIRFSFTEGDSLVTVLETAEPENGVTTFDVYAWLTDITPVAKEGEAFLHLGGMELILDISGAEAFIIEQEFPSQAMNLGKEMGRIAAGMSPGEKIRDGKVMLVRWKIMIQGRPENVRLGLDPSGLQTARTLEGCEECAPQALYVGNESSRQVGIVFGAGYEPAWINPTGEIDQTPVTGKCSWRDVGVFEAR
jgi:hypothetical protein